MKVDWLVSQLQLYGYDENKTKYLEEGFCVGFDIGYDGPRTRRSLSNNLPIKQGIGSKTELWNKLMKEVKLKRVAGPFKDIPYENFIQSPIGLVPKAGNSGQTRLIFHLSYDFDKNEERSLNFYTPKSKCSVKYRDLDHAVNAYLRV